MMHQNAREQFADPATPVGTLMPRCATSFPPRAPRRDDELAADGEVPQALADSPTRSGFWSTRAAPQYRRGLGSCATSPGPCRAVRHQRPEHLRSNIASLEAITAEKDQPARHLSGTRRGRARRATFSGSGVEPLSAVSARFACRERIAPLWSGCGPRSQPQHPTGRHHRGPSSPTRADSAEPAEGESSRRQPTAQYPIAAISIGTAVSR